ncbi:alpha/beta fold hydrolase [Flavihumibacter solisilvae]|jgi:pimeloyl-ACP methyl ester carboxylesterase|uniref:AB hydrolase-1 domain-containing protein n=1 Tax=Flavihumibacter solisilvae TaxID=1349421 RepID=A0A0C1L0U9_9BACT|nr:alpha/beta hydrolase [Flavihumibacter solisilvae]KIC93231.1 hypothetical protein OI18_18430 [Flavihumibacter solisilvae]
MIHYTATGNGEPIFLVHGFGEDSRIWEQQVNPLAAKYRVFLPDLPGAGKSAGKPGLSIESMADDLAEILDHEKIDKVVMAGHSMGGYVTLAFAEKYPLKLKAFSLIHSTAFADNEQKKDTRRKSIDIIRQYGTKPFLESAIPNMFAVKNRTAMVKMIDKIIAENKHILPGSLISFYEAMMIRPDRTGILKNASIPVQFIVGKEDQAVPFSDSMQQIHLPDLSYIHILETSGHMGMIEEPDKTNTSLLEFLRKL